MFKHLLPLLWVVFAIANAHAADKGVVTRDSEILLVFWGASDCIYCTRWKSAPEGKGALQSWPEFDKIAYREVERPQMATSLKVEHFPADLAWLYEGRAVGGKLRSTYVPSWSIFVDRFEVMRAMGYGRWESEVFPQVKHLVAKRDARRRSASPLPAAR
ncbi:MAG: hypothetical protein HZC24_17260 [Rhodocyclales bacterium]|nr:hypothetical protein [Rhodocyclales bacterium]